MIKHTPGPWQARKDRWYLTIEAGDCWVAQVPNFADRTTERMEANARLISAAPDLVEACSLAAAEFKSQWDSGGKRGSGFLAAYDAARKAIRKATEDHPSSTNATE